MLLTAFLVISSSVAAEEALDDAQEERVRVAQAEPDPQPEKPAPSQTGSGGDSQEAPPGIEVMHVKGRGVGSIETEVQSSVTQFDASTIEALGAQNIADLSRVTPNVNIVQPGATQATFFVRGIGLSDFSSNAAGAVTILQDDVAINAAPIQTGQLFDVETVDIVKGPQGTGHFRNASGGAILVRSKRPTGNYGSQLRSSFGQYRTKGDKGARHAFFQDYEGALEVPIVADALSTRFAFRLREGEPYKTNNCGYSIPFDQRLPRSNDVNQLRRANSQMCGEGENPNVIWPNTRPASVSQIPYPLPYSVGDEHNWAARGMLRFQPKDTDLEFLLNGHGSRLDQDSTLGQVVGTRTFPGSGTQGSQDSYGQQSALGYRERDALEEFNFLCQQEAGRCTNAYTNTILSKNIATRPLDKRPYRGDYNRVGDETRDAYGAYVSGQGPITDDVSLFVVSSFDQYVRSTENDTDFTPDRLFELEQDDKAWQLWNEVRLEGELAFEPIQWNLGVYNLREHLHNDGVLFTGQNQKVDINRKYSQKIDSWGAWGEFSWDFADDFTLEGGVRYNYEKKNFHFNIVRWQYPLTAPALPPTSPTFPGPAFIGSRKTSETWEAPTGQITLTYHLDATSHIYAKYSRGFKAGHFNALAAENLDNPPADAEYNDAWEVGLRGGFLGGLMSLGAAGFYYRYENYQVFLFQDSASTTSPPVLEILNAKQAENFGVEVEGQIAPLRGWTPRLIEGLRVSGNFGWIHGEYLDFVTTRFLRGQANALIPVPVDYSGLTLQNAPEYKASGTIEWTFDLGRWGYIVPRYDINWTDDVFFDPNEGHGSKNIALQDTLPDYAIGQKQYYLQNARLAYRTPTGNVEVAAWVRNIDDRVYKNYAFDASFFTNVTINFPGTPRTIGMDVIITF
jgi:outer membrane receptor protein involved in Fe transport